MLGFYGVLLRLCGIILLLWPFLACWKSKYTRHWCISTLTRGAEQQLSSWSYSGVWIQKSCLDTRVGVPRCLFLGSGQRIMNDGREERTVLTPVIHVCSPLLSEQVCWPWRCFTLSIQKNVTHVEDKIKNRQKIWSWFLHYAAVIYRLQYKRKPMLQCSDLAVVVQINGFCVGPQIFPAWQLYLNIILISASS